jgi:hypothetical protein
MELQRTSEWKMERLGKFTSSNIWKLMTDPKGKTPFEKWEEALIQLGKWESEYENTKNKETKTAKEKLEKIKKLSVAIVDLDKNKNVKFLSDTAKTYILERVVEQIGGFIPESDSNATIYGTNQEPEALYWYSKLTGYELEKVGFMEYKGLLGGSPDALVLDRDSNQIGVAEVKCPYNSVNHLKHRLINSPEYFKENHFDYYYQCVSNTLVSKAEWAEFISFDSRIDHEIGFFKFRLYRDDSEIKQLIERVVIAEEYMTELKIKIGLL